MELQPDMRPAQGTLGAVPTPESSFNFEKQKLQKLKQELEGKNSYQRLGVPVNASPEEIKKAFIQKTKDSHPANKPKELEDGYSEILRLYVEANANVSDPGRKKAYDITLMKTQARNARPKPQGRRSRFGPDGQRLF